jgi:phosphatidylglycerol:prolipoprotein diacylglycerol transferase
MPSAYSWLLLAGILVTLIFWSRLAKRDSRLMMIYLAALAGAFVGAKIIYLVAEGWMYWNSPDRWLIWATGKTILGALLGGYAAVEIAKLFLGYSQTTGDWFALISPVGIILGRIGCLLHGCCLGAPCGSAWWTLRDRSGMERWPAVPVEIGFNALALFAFLILRKCRLLPGQHFHLYLMSYGAFRFAHEFVRATPRVSHGITGYQLAALGVFALGLMGFVRRHALSLKDKRTLHAARRADSWRI